MESTSVSTIRTIHQNFLESELCHSSSSVPASPKSSHSGSLPSPPDSPDSVSSFPSVSSSFFFSSAAASPPHSDYGKDSTQGLIIPSLTLPSALKQPTQYGKTLGQVRLIFLCRKGAAENLTVQLLLDDNPDIVDVESWEQLEYGRLMRASTDWVEHLDPHGLDKFEPTRNVEVIEACYDHSDDVHDVLNNIMAMITSSFEPVSDLLVPHPHSDLIIRLLASSSSPLYTALILAIPPSPTSVEDDLIDGIASRIPLIVLHRPSSRQHHRIIHKVASFKPSTLMALRNGLFRSPETLNSLRIQAAEKFLEWREVESALGTIRKSRKKRKRGMSWNKSNWEAELENQLSKQVALHLQQEERHEAEEGSVDSQLSLDPLHLRSLLVFSLSILGPLHGQISRAFIDAIQAISSCHVKLAVFGGFCVGLGTGICIVR